MIEINDLPAIHQFLILLSFIFVLIFFDAKKNRTCFYLMLSSVLISTFFFYKGVLSDWKTYREYVDLCTEVGCSYFEPGFDFLIYISSQTLGFDLIKFVSLILLFYFIFIVDAKYKERRMVLFSLSIFIAFLPLYFGAIRQAISCIFIWLILLSFIHGKPNYLKILIYFIVAVLFHYSAIPSFLLCCVIYHFYSRRDARKKDLVFYAILSGFLYYMFNSYVGYLDIESFQTTNHMVEVDSTGLKSLLIPVERFFVFSMAVFLLLYRPNNELEKLMIVVCMVSSAFYMLMFTISLMTAGRLSASFKIFDIYIVYLFFDNILGRRVGYLAVLFYSLIKIYFTILSVGFFK